MDTKPLEYHISTKSPPHQEAQEYHIPAKSPLSTSDSTHSIRHSTRLDLPRERMPVNARKTLTSGADLLPKPGVPVEEDAHGEVNSYSINTDSSKLDEDELLGISGTPDFSDEDELLTPDEEEKERKALKESRRMKMMRKELETIESKLSARDHAVLLALRKYRFLTSDQIGRLYVKRYSTKTAQTRNRNLLLKRLSELGLINSLARRVGGYGGGSTVAIWHLTEIGYRILTLNDPDSHPRKRFKEPSTQFLMHTLAIAECAVQLTMITRESEDIDLLQVDTEPDSWRVYEKDGQVNYLKPDLFFITNYDDYEDRWFVEIDLGTESIPQVLRKCNYYLSYYYTGIEQRKNEVFPLITWIVKDEKRKQSIKEALTEQMKEHPKMFLVITPDELEKMVRQFIPASEVL